MKAADTLQAMGISATVADARFAKPLDEALIRKLLAEHEAVITVEEGAAGGFGGHVLSFAANEGLLDAKAGRTPKIRSLCLPDYFMEHASPADQHAEAGLDAVAIVNAAAQMAQPKAVKLKTAG